MGEPEGGVGELACMSKTRLDMIEWCLLWTPPGTAMSAGRKEL